MKQLMILNGSHKKSENGKNTIKETPLSKNFFDINSKL
jgi:hypothetical protein